MGDMGMRSARRIAVSATAGAAAALAIAVPMASATFLQNGANATGTGANYTGAVTGSAVGNAVFNTAFGAITCNQAPLSGTITDAGSASTQALGNFASADFKNSGAEACPDVIPTVDHENFFAQGVPWGVSFEWIDNHTDGTPNATALLSNVGIMAELSSGDDCPFRADFNNTGGTTNQVQADVYNPDNSPTGHLEIRLVTEPFETTSVSGLCGLVPTATVTLTWQVTGAPGAGELSVRGPPPPVCNDLALSTPFQTPLNGTFQCTGWDLAGISVGPAHGEATASPPNFTYTPDPGYSGPDSFVYVATNAGGSDHATVNITVGQPPATGGGDTGGSGGTQGQTGGKKKKCKKKPKKKSAAAAKKCKKKKT
jgi:hypothetical protein